MTQDPDKESFNRLNQQPLSGAVQRCVEKSRINCPKCLTIIRIWNALGWAEISVMPQTPRNLSADPNGSLHIATLVGHNERKLDSINFIEWLKTRDFEFDGQPQLQLQPTLKVNAQGHCPHCRALFKIDLRPFDIRTFGSDPMLVELKRIPGLSSHLHRIFYGHNTH